MAFMSEPCQQDTTTWGQLLIFVSFLINVFFQRKDKLDLQKKAEETAQKLATATGAALKLQTDDIKTSLDEQTDEIKKAARSRLTDLGQQFDSLLTEDQRKRRKDD
jgi:hypothetical protein